jgi:hypothetical protein
MALAHCTLDNYGKNTGAHSEYEIFIALPLQKWLRERALMLRLYVLVLSRLPVSLLF